MKKINIDELLKELDKYNFKQLHIHHTWKPEHKDFKGNNHIAMQQAMKNYHMNVRKWPDIGQHVSLFPDGVFVTGRPFNKTPASIKGWNTGAFATETIGNFDVGHDKLEGPQKESLLKLTNYFINRYGEQSIKFHREGPGAGKTCPGTSIDKLTLIREAKDLDKKATPIISVTPDVWAKKDWDWATNKGYFDGTRPKDPITRQEMAVVVRRIVDKK